MIQFPNSNIFVLPFFFRDYSERERALSETIIVPDCERIERGNG
ncbi:MAG: hypothetical protein ACD_8C00012G0007 [uncultured bacterium]|nr:MAG: hypothetical protein ACD_8C00012G0007 [uncultured bacterium]